MTKGLVVVSFFFSSRRRHTRWTGDWSSDVCSSDLAQAHPGRGGVRLPVPQRLVDLGVAGHRPDAVALQPYHRPGFPQFGVEGERVTQEAIGERVQCAYRRPARARLRRRVWHLAASSVRCDPSTADSAWAGAGREDGLGSPSVSDWAGIRAGGVVFEDEAVLVLNKPAGISVMGE